MPHSNFLIKLKNWEYWPFGIVQLPAILYFVGLVARTRSLTFFSASNPGIPMGGMFGESKFDVLKLVPDPLKPSTLLIKQPQSIEFVLETIAKSGLSFPLVFKPDVGERGYRVKRVYSEAEAHTYHNEMPFDYLIQEMVDLPLEFGVYYARIPGSEKGSVTSIVEKELLFVEGTGKATLQELIFAKDRAKLQWQSLKITFEAQLNTIIPKGEKVLLVPIGNHCLGTKFLNGNHLIDEKIHAAFDQISKQIPGFYYGRFDLRCSSIEDLKSGRVMVLELNGCGAEPAHIYHPGYPLWRGMMDLVKHWELIYKISRQNNLSGIPYIVFKDALYYFRRFKERTAI